MIAGFFMGVKHRINPFPHVGCHFLFFCLLRPATSGQIRSIKKKKKKPSRYNVVEKATDPIKTLYLHGLPQKSNYSVLVDLK